MVNCTLRSAACKRLTALLDGATRLMLPCRASQIISLILESSISGMANLCLMMLYVCFLLAGKFCLSSIASVCLSSITMCVFLCDRATELPRATVWA